MLEFCKLRKLAMHAVSSDFGMSAVAVPSQPVAATAPIQPYTPKRRTKIYRDGWEGVLGALSSDPLSQNGHGSAK